MATRVFAHSRIHLCDWQLQASWAAPKRAGPAPSGAANSPARLGDGAQQAGVESIPGKQHQGIAAKAAQPAHLPQLVGRQASGPELVSG